MTDFSAMCTIQLFQMTSIVPQFDIVLAIAAVLLHMV